MDRRKKGHNAYKARVYYDAIKEIEKINQENWVDLRSKIDLPYVSKERYIQYLIKCYIEASKKALEENYGSNAA